MRKDSTKRCFFHIYCLFMPWIMKVCPLFQVFRVEMRSFRARKGFFHVVTRRFRRGFGCFRAGNRINNAIKRHVWRCNGTSPVGDTFKVLCHVFSGLVN